MITYDDIKKANGEITTTSIKGKDYAEVNQRIKAFRMVYPDGFIVTEMASNENGICVFSARVGYYTEDGGTRIVGTGTAYEKENSTFINKTSYIENCETSAVGRALGMAGFGIDTSVASAEEVETAIINQKHDRYPKTICPVCGIQILKMTTPKGRIWTPKEILEKYGMCGDCYKKSKLTDEVDND